MSNTFFNIFPNENFIDLCMYQFGYEQCDPGHSFGPATRPSLEVSTIFFRSTNDILPLTNALK